MASIRYESLLVEQALAREYAAEMERALKAMGGLNDIKLMIRDFEKDFARYIGVKNAVAVNSGSDALKMALLAAGVGPKDEVIVPDLTYHAVALAVVYCGAKPVPVDAKADDLQIDPAAVEAAITKKTKAVIGAHMFGRACDVDKIGTLCRDRKIIFIEDVCQAESSHYKGRLLGSFADMAAFSFSYYKPLSSCGGGGGMVVSNNEKINRIRHWMEDWRDDAELLTLGQRFAPMAFMDIIALRVKFARIKEIIKSRRQIKAFYEKELGQIKGLTIFRDGEGVESVAQNFVVCCEKRDRLLDWLEGQGVMIQRAYSPLHKTAICPETKKGRFPVSEWYASHALHLPLFSFMSQAKAGTVVECCRTFFAGRAA